MAERDTPRFDNAPPKVSDDKGAPMSHAPTPHHETTCCSRTEQTTCCEPADKADCCGNRTTDDGCGCR